ncbi:MAG: HPr family phosphocarrier protein, partial [Morganella morganii]
MTIRCQVEIKNRLGLHARPAMKLFELIQTFRSTVVFRNKQNEEARADSVLAMLMLDSEQG